MTMDQLLETTNGTKATEDTKKKKPKEEKKKHLPSLPSATSAAEMTAVTFAGLVDKTPIEWVSLANYEVFSLSPDGSFPLLKANCSKAVRLSDRKVLPVGSGRCYRISLSNH